MVVGREFDRGLDLGTGSRVGPSTWYWYIAIVVRCTIPRVLVLMLVLVLVLVYVRSG